MKDPSRFLLTGIFGITFDRTTEICLSVFDKPVHCPTSRPIPFGWCGLIESSPGIRIYHNPCIYEVPRM